MQPKQDEYVPSTEVDLADLIAARVPLIKIDCSDNSRVSDYLRSSNRMSEFKIFDWTSWNGLQFIGC